jgi:hypothetical protein
MRQFEFAQPPQTKLNGFTGAIADFTNAIGIYPNDAGAYYNRGGATLSVGQNDSGCLDLG